MGIFMDRSTLPSADPSTVWLADLIEAAEVVAASAEPCDPAKLKAFGHRLESGARSSRPLGHRRIRHAELSPIIVKVRYA